MIRQLFPTQLYFADLAAPSRVQKLNAELAREARILREIDDSGRRWSKSNYLGGYTSYASMNDLHLTSPTFEELRKRIDTHVAAFARALEMDLGGGRLQMSTCWVNIMPPGSHHSGHIHPLSTISGTYYVEIPRGSSSIKFEDPRLPYMMAAPPARAKASLKNRRSVEIKPRPGKVALFESWLRHEVPANSSPSERISVSFNYEWS